MYVFRVRDWARYQFCRIYFKICRRGAPAKILKKFAVGPDFHQDLSNLRCGVGGWVRLGLLHIRVRGLGLGLGLGLGSGLVLLCLYMPALQGSALGSGPTAPTTKTQPRTLTYCRVRVRGLGLVFLCLYASVAEFCAGIWPQRRRVRLSTAR